MKNIIEKNSGIILPFWNYIFEKLEKFSLFYAIRYIYNKRTDKSLAYVFVESWVLVHIVLAFFSSVMIFNHLLMPISLGIVIYGMLRTFEIIIYQINVILFHPYRAKLKGEPYKIKSATRMVVILFHNFFEIIFWYASAYIALTRFTGIALADSWFYYIKMSILCFATFDTTLIFDHGVARIISNIAFFEVMSGVIMTIISLARFIGLLPEVDSID